MYGAVMEKERKNVTSAVRSASHSVRRENRTGIPTQLKERMEQSTGLSFDDVRVHYNSALPARLDALAYTQGNQVEIGPGQERHLPHELGHVVQQKLGAVRANATHSSGVALNTDPALEHQADELGAGKKLAIVQRMRNNNIIQRCGDEEDSQKEEEKEDESQEQESREHSPSSDSPGTNIGFSADDLRTVVKTSLGNDLNTAPSSIHSTTNVRPGITGTPNSSVDYVNAANRVIQRRWYDSAGKVFRDVDMTDHGNRTNHPEVPHEHTWVWTGGKPVRH